MGDGRNSFFIAEAEKAVVDFLYLNLGRFDNNPREALERRPTMPNKPTVKKFDAGYEILRRKVEQVLIFGRRKIEEAKVMTYLDSGKLIDEHVRKNGGTREESYGKEIVRNLSADLKVSPSVLWRCVRFARGFKEIAASRPLSLPKNLAWSHYRALITVPDEDSRFSFMKRAEKGDWTSDELVEKIRLERAESSSGHSEEMEKPVKHFPKLIPKKGSLYTYRLIAPDSARQKEDERLWVDLGFQVRRKIPSNAKGSKENEIVESIQKDDGYSIVASKGTQDDLYTYKAFVERVVDADTLIVKIDLGFETRIRQYLRLRGINAPELETEEGKKARAFVERELSKVPHIILTSSRSDKYDRYLADVFYGESDKEIYLNQFLLDEGLAERW